MSGMLTLPNACHLRAALHPKTPDNTNEPYSGATGLPQPAEYGALNMHQDKHQDNPTTAPSRGQRFLTWIQEPFGSIIFASASTIGSFGVVLSGMWAIQATLN